MKHIAIFAILALASFCVCGNVFAAETPAAETEHGATADHGEHEETIWQFLGKWINFAILAALLYFFAKKSLRIQDRFSENYTKIQSSIESARMAKEEAEQKLKELDQKMNQLSDDITRLKAEAAREAEEEKKKILEAAQKEAERIVEQAHREIDSEVEIARKELQKQITDQAVDRSREIIERELNDQDQKRLIHDYIQGFNK